MPEVSGNVCGNNNELVNALYTSIEPVIRLLNKPKSIPRLAVLVYSQVKVGLTVRTQIGSGNHVGPIVIHQALQCTQRLISIDRLLPYTAITGP